MQTSKSNLRDYQLGAIDSLRTGSILCGGVGSGKSRTSLGYYFFKECKGSYDKDGVARMECPRDLYIITTAKKRDTSEWLDEMLEFDLSTKPLYSVALTNVVIDSWNNIKKYADVENAFFIFDEQRLVGKGVWVKTFLKISKKNHWILLTATPGDTWLDYIPVFLANGYYQNRSEFLRKHVIFSPYTKYPKVQKFINVRELERHKADILVNMDYHSSKKRVFEIQYTGYNHDMYKTILKDRFDPFERKPIAEQGKLMYLLRKVCNSDFSKERALNSIYVEHKKCIIFYNFDYELFILRNWAEFHQIPCSEWNGHHHEGIKHGDTWAYLVQYTSGCEGWNCIETDTVIFYSLSYSYKTMIQAAGRIDRMNSPYDTLYYYSLVSNADIDGSINKALNNKRSFNEKTYLNVQKLQLL